MKETGGSTLAAREIWWDGVVRRLNNDSRGTLLGAFKGDDKILTLYKSGHYKLTGFELSNKFDDDLIHIEKWYPNRPLACVYFYGKKDLYYVKRFLVEETAKKTLFIPDDESCDLTVASTQFIPRVKIEFNKRLKETKDVPDKTEELNNLIDVKGLKAMGNQLTKLKVKQVSLLPTKDGEEWPEIEENPKIEDPAEETDNNSADKNVSKVIGTVNDEKPIEIELSLDKENVKNDKKEEPGEQINLFE